MAAALLFLAWRVVIGPQIVPITRGDPLVIVAAAGQLVLKTVRGYAILLLYAWRYPFWRMFTEEFWLPWLPWLVAAIATSLVLAHGQYAGRRTLGSDVRSPTEPVPPVRTAAHYLQALIGGLLLAGLGFVVLLPTVYWTPLPDNLLTRVSTVATLGAATSVVAAVAALAHRLSARPQAMMTFGVALLVGLATGNNYLVQEGYVSDWHLQRSIWWQLSWRAPQLRPGTYLILSGPQAQTALHRRFNPWEITNAANIFHGPGNVNGEHLTAETLERVQPEGLVAELPHGPLPVSYDHILVAHYGDGCLKLIDGRVPLPEGSDPLLAIAGRLSNLDNIITTPAESGSDYGPQKRMLGEPPDRGWCFHYQQAERHAQERQWARIAELHTMAVQAGLRPQDPSEWYPFIEAYNRLGAYDQATALVRRAALTASPMAHQALRTRLEVLKRDIGQSEGHAAIVEQLALLD